MDMEEIRDFTDPEFQEVFRTYFAEIGVNLKPDTPGGSHRRVHLLPAGRAETPHRLFHPPRGLHPGAVGPSGGPGAGSGPRPGGARGGGTGEEGVTDCQLISRFNRFINIEDVESVSVDGVELPIIK